MKWTEQEDRVLRAMYFTHTRKEIAEVLMRSEGSVRSRCHTLGLASKLSVWTEYEIEQIRSAYDVNSSADIDLDGLASRLGRDKTNICRKARMLGLTDLSRAKKRPDQCADRGPIFSNDKDRREHQSKLMKERLKSHGHPRGALGMKHSKESKEKISSASRRAWRDPDSGLNSVEMAEKRRRNMYERIRSGKMRSRYTRSAGGKRKDLDNRYFRSAWEANYARYLNYLVGTGQIERWEYEPVTFEFRNIKRGIRFYTPDFRVWDDRGSYEWHEVKGWMDQPSRTRLKRMAKYYPDEKILLIDEKWFRSAARQGLPRIIPHWESQGRGGRGC